MTASRTGGSMRGELLDKMLLYLRFSSSQSSFFSPANEISTFRLFFGMGIIWYFEVISFYLRGEWSTTTDIINMLQGVWVFLTFVCKRNVLQVILRRRDKLYSAVLQRARSKSSKDLNKKYFGDKNISDATNQTVRAESVDTERKRVISLRTEEV